jgi:hypothetical protein
MMNKLKMLQFSLLFPCFLNTLNAQSPQLIVNEIKGVMSQGQQVGQEMIIPEIDAKLVESAISKWAKGYKAKLISPKKGAVEYLIDNATIPTVSDNTVDIYAIVSAQAGGGVLFRTYADLGGTFLTSADHPQAFAAFERELIAFGKEQMIAFADNNVKTEEKHLSKLESELKSLQKDKAGYEKDIRNHTDNIAKREQEIIQNESDQKLKEQQITIQQGIVQEVRMKRSSMGTMDEATKKLLDNQVKTEEKNLKTFENQLKSLRSNLAAAVKDIEKSRSTIAQREQDIIKNGQDQQTKEQQIDLQKKILEMVRQKRAEIR